MPRKAKDAAGAKIVAALQETFRKYVAMDPGLPLVLALWTLATHAFDCFDAFPYLAITSPTKRCGKTRLAEIIEMLSCNGQRIVGATPAAIFRTIQTYEADGGTVTLIMDEAEVLGVKSDRSETLREVLNAGYRRGQSVPRCERNSEGQYKVERFNVYCPKVIVLIGNLNDTLADRCIPVAMRRRKPGEHVERFFYSRVVPEAKRLRKEMETWAKARRLIVKSSHQQDVGFLEDREAELWSPLFAICTVAAPDKLEHLKDIALKISGAKLADGPADMGILLLKDIRDAFVTSQQDRLSTLDVLNTLNAIEESPWAAWSRGVPLDARKLSRSLRPFGISPHNVRLSDDRVVKGYERRDFEESWATYLPPDLATTGASEPSESNDSDTPASAT